MAGPAALPALRLALEREAAQRGRRLAEAASERARDRLRPRGDRMRALQVRPSGRFAWRSLSDAGIGERWLLAPTIFCVIALTVTVAIGIWQMLGEDSDTESDER